MLIDTEYWEYKNVSHNGECEDEGSVETSPLISVSGNHHNMTLSTIKSGSWIFISTGLSEDGTVKGITAYFEDQDALIAELKRLLNLAEAT